MRAPSDQNGSLSPYGKKAAAGVSVASEENTVRVETGNYDYDYLCSDLRDKRMVPILGRIRAHDIKDFDELPHHRGEEFIYVLEGEPTLVTDKGEVQLSPGMCAGFPAQGLAHQLVNRTDRDVVYLEIGDRTPGDGAAYPRDDLKASFGPDGGWTYTHKDGRAY